MRTAKTGQFGNRLQDINQQHSARRPHASTDELATEGRFSASIPIIRAFKICETSIVDNFRRSLPRGDSAEISQSLVGALKYPGYKIY
ncbi:hypothetical protein CQ013_08820 [Arthrobacter sp. MYb216]|nr:hypothetical protein CQ013_08820 [Arthrobacter sp. MYb216]